MAILDFSKLRKRAGRCISDNPFKLDESKWEEKRSLMRKPRFMNNQRYADSFRRQTEIVDAIVSMEKAQQPIGPLQLVGALTLAHGVVWTDTRAMLDYLNAIGSLERTGIVSPRWTSRCFDGPMKKGLPKRIENILKEYSSPLTSVELIRMLYPGTGDAERKRKLNDVNLVCNLLDTTEWITKLPADSAMQHNNYRWIHESWRNSPETIPRWNIRYVLLQIIDNQGPIAKSSLMKEPMVMGLISAHTTNLSDSMLCSVMENPLDCLRAQGLIATEIVPGQRATQYFGITDYGHELLTKTSASNCLDEDLRLLLLESKKDIRPSQIDRADRIIRWLKVLIEMDKGYGKSHMITKRLGENEGYVRGIVNGGASPCTRISDERLIGEYLPAVLAHSEKYAKRLEQYIKERNGESDSSD
jgi:hypothetical protein